MNDVATRLRTLVERIERTSALDRAVATLEPVVQRLTRSDAVKAALSGAPLGHRLHPALSDVPTGAWLSASFLDVFGGRGARSGARRLVAFGIVAALPTAAAGLSDWQDIDRENKRVGVVHAAANSAGLLCQLASWSARRRGYHLRGKLWSALGVGAVGAGGYLGGHLVFARRVGVDAEVPDLKSYGWHYACRADELIEGQPRGVEIEGVRIVLVRDGAGIHALAATCTHAGGPLDQGRVSDGLIECPWHGSRFALEDGHVERGPATTPEPVYEARQRGDRIDVRKRPRTLLKFEELNSRPVPVGD